MTAGEIRALALEEAAANLERTIPTVTFTEQAAGYRNGMRAAVRELRDTATRARKKEGQS